MTWITDARAADKHTVSMPLDLHAMLSAAENRLEQARDIADAYRGRSELHRVLMRGVFLMEDVVFMLHEMAALEHESRRDHRTLLADDRL